MHPHYQHFLVIRSVENSDLPSSRNNLVLSPKKVVGPVSSIRGRLKGIHVASLRIDSRHYLLDRSVFARSIHALKNQQQRPLILRIQLSCISVSIRQLPSNMLSATLFDFTPSVSPGSKSFSRTFSPFVMQYGEAIRCASLISFARFHRAKVVQRYAQRRTQSS